MWFDNINEQNKNPYEYTTPELDTFTHLVLANGYLRAANSFAKAFIKIANNNDKKRRK